MAKDQIVVVGHGAIGKELVRQLTARGYKVVAILTRRAVLFPTGLAQPEQFHQIAESPDEVLRKLSPLVAAGRIDAAMIAIGNNNKGADELAYMRAFAELGVPIVTCAKAAHAYHFKQVMDLGVPVGRRATVGGGTDMLAILRRRHLQNDDLILDVIANGTLNFIFQSVQSGSSPIGAISDAKDLGYAEPGSTDYVRILNGELADLRMKATILHNVVLASGDNFLTPDEFGVTEFEDVEDIHRLSPRNKRFRYILSFSSVEDYDKLPGGQVGSLRAQCGRWVIRGGFHNVSAETHWYDWLREMGGVMNGWRIYPRSKDGPYSFVGPGAGPETTAAAMIRDLEDLRLAV